MDRLQKFGRNSKRFFERLSKKEEEKSDNLNFTTEIHTEEVKIVWKLNNFDRCPLLTGEYHQSRFFCTGFSTSTKWALRIYPRGKAVKGRVGFSLYRMPSSSKILLNFAFVVRLPSSEKGGGRVLEKKNIRMNTEECFSEIEPPVFDFLSQKWVEISCSLTVGYVDEADDVDNCNAGSQLCSLSADFKEILSSGKFSDVTLQAGKKQFRVHKAILSARSKVFAAMFDHPMEESQTSVVNIEDVEPSVLSDFIHYLYTGAIEDLTVDKASVLFSAADKYCLADLRQRCVRVMLAKLCVENVCQVATLADMHSEQKLKTAANYVFRKYKQEIFERKEWKTLIQQRQLLATEILQNVTTEFNNSCEDPFEKDS